MKGKKLLAALLVAVVLVAGAAGVFVLTSKGDKLTVGTVSGAGTRDYIDGAIGRAAFASPTSLTVSGSDLYVFDTANNVIRKISYDTVSTAAGKAWCFSGADTGGCFKDGSALESFFYTPTAGCITQEGALLFADSGSGAIRFVNFAEGKTGTFIAPASIEGYPASDGTESVIKSPYAVISDGGDGFYVSDTGSHCILHSDAVGKLTVFAGVAGTSGLLDGNTAEALFFEPTGMALGSDGTLYVADSGNNCIRVIKDGTVKALFGASNELSDVTGRPTGGDLDGDALSARLSYPTGLALGSDGTLYIADTNNSKIKAYKDGKVYAVAGSTAGYLDSADSLTAQFNMPEGIAVSDENNCLYIADSGNNAIRVIDLSKVNKKSSDKGAMGETEATARTVTVSKLDLGDGKATVRRGAEVTDAYEGMRLAAGDRVLTDTSARVYLSIDDDKTILLDKCTSLTINSSGKKLLLSVDEGSMVFDVTKPLSEDESCEFNAGGATMSIRGTQGVIGSFTEGVNAGLTEGKLEVNPCGVASDDERFFFNPVVLGRDEPVINTKYKTPASAGGSLTVTAGAMLASPGSHMLGPGELMSINFPRDENTDPNNMFYLGLDPDLPIVSERIEPGELDTLFFNKSPEARLPVILYTLENDITRIDPGLNIQLSPSIVRLNLCGVEEHRFSADTSHNTLRCELCKTYACSDNRTHVKYTCITCSTPYCSAGGGVCTNGGAHTDTFAEDPGLDDVMSQNPPDPSPPDPNPPEPNPPAPDTVHCHRVAEERLGVLAATCTEDGYTGDIKCTACKEILEQGAVIPKLGHTPGTERVNAAEATCTTDGYTGDIKCTVCEEILEQGAVITKLGHDYVYTYGDTEKHTVTCTRCTYEASEAHTQAPCGVAGHCTVCNDSGSHYIMDCGHPSCDTSAADHSLAGCGEHYMCEPGFDSHEMLMCGHFACDEVVTDHSIAPCGTHFVCDGLDHGALSCGNHFMCSVNEADIINHATLASCGEHYSCDTSVSHALASCGDHHVCDGLDHSLLSCGEHYTCSVDETADHMTLAECGEHYLCQIEPNDSSHGTLAPCETHYLCDTSVTHELASCGEHYICEGGSHALQTCGAHYACEGGTGHDETLPCGNHYVCCGEDAAKHAQMDCGHYTCDSTTVSHSQYDCGHYRCQDPDESNHYMLDCGHYRCDAEIANHEPLACGNHFVCNVDEADRAPHEALASCGEHYSCDTSVSHALASCGDHHVCDGLDHSLLSCGEHYVCAAEETADHMTLAECGEHYLCQIEPNDSSHGTLAPCETHYLCDTSVSHELASCGEHYICEGGSHALQTCGAHYACEGGTGHDETLPCGNHYVCCGEDAAKHAIMDCGHYTCESTTVSHSQYDCGHYRCQDPDESNHYMLDCGHYRCDAEIANHEPLACGSHFVCNVDEADREAHAVLAECGEHYSCSISAEDARRHSTLAACGEHFTCSYAIGSSEDTLHNNTRDCGIHYGCNSALGYMPCGDHCACNEESDPNGVYLHTETYPCGVYMCGDLGNDEPTHGFMECGKHCLCQVADEADMENHVMTAECGHFLCEIEDGDESHYTVLPCGVHYECNLEDESLRPEHTTPLSCGHYPCDLPPEHDEQTCNGPEVLVS